MRAVEEVRRHPRHLVLFAVAAGLLLGPVAPAGVLVVAGAAAWLAGRMPLARDRRRGRSRGLGARAGARRGDHVRRAAVAGRAEDRRARDPARAGAPALQRQLGGARPPRGSRPDRRGPGVVPHGRPRRRGGRRARRRRAVAAGRPRRQRAAPSRHRRAARRLRRVPAAARRGRCDRRGLVGADRRRARRPARAAGRGARTGGARARHRAGAARGSAAARHGPRAGRGGRQRRPRGVPALGPRAPPGRVGPERPAALHARAGGLRGPRRAVARPADRRGRPRRRVRAAGGRWPVDPARRGDGDRRTRRRARRSSVVAVVRARSRRGGHADAQPARVGRSGMAALVRGGRRPAGAGSAAA